MGTFPQNFGLLFLFIWVPAIVIILGLITNQNFDINSFNIFAVLALFGLALLTFMLGYVTGRHDEDIKRSIKEREKV